MKNKTLFLLLVALAALAFTTATVIASPLDPAPAAAPTHEKKGQDKTPGPPAFVEDKQEVKATEKALQHETRQDKKDVRQAEKDARQAGKKLHFKGTIAGVTADSLTLLLADGSSVLFSLTSESIIKVPTLGLLATWEDLLPGAKANVQAVETTPGQGPAGPDPAAEDPAPTMTVLKVLVIPGKPIKTHRVGLVTAYEPGVSITIEEKDHKLYTYPLTPETPILPVDPAAEPPADPTAQIAVGSRVTVIVVGDPTTGQATVMAIVVHPLTACDVADPESPETCPPTTPEDELK